MRTTKLSLALAAAALVIAALGATPLGHAAGQLILPRASVGTPQLKAGAVTGLKVKDGSLAAADFAAGQLPAGPKGDKGDTGEAGPPGLSGYEVVKGTVVNLAAGATYFSQINCPSGRKAIGSGFIGGVDGMATIFSYPFNEVSGAGWYLRVKNLGAATSFGAYAICVSVG
jgi:hypothetical protein